MGVEGKDSKYKEGHCSAGRFDSSLENNRVDFLAKGGGGCLKSEVTKFTSLSYTSIFLHQNASFNPNVPMPHSCLLLIKEFKNLSSYVLQAFNHKGAVENLSLRELMNLPICMRKSGLIKCAAVHIKDK